MSEADPFTLLDEPRRPLGDDDALRERYHAVSARLHPDVAAAGAGGEAFSAYTLAYQTLSEPRTRLRALLELERGGPAPRHQNVPEAIAALFSSMSLATREVDGFLKKRAAASSTLARAMLMDEGYQLAEACETHLATLEAERNRVLAQITTADQAWEAGERPLAQLEEAAQALGYLDKWRAQLREGLLRIQLDQ